MPSDVADLPIYDVASEVLEFERSVALDTTFDIELGPQFGPRETFGR